MDSKIYLMVISSVNINNILPRPLCHSGHITLLLPNTLIYLVFMGFIFNVKSLIVTSQLSSAIVLSTFPIGVKFSPSFD